MFIVFDEIGSFICLDYNILITMVYIDHGNFDF